MSDAGVAQSVERLICNQQVGGSNPSTSSILSSEFNKGEFPSGQRGQTVNLLSVTSMVRIHLPPPKIDNFRQKVVDFLSKPQAWYIIRRQAVYHQRRHAAFVYHHAIGVYKNLPAA